MSKKMWEKLNAKYYYLFERIEKVIGHYFGRDISRENRSSGVFKYLKHSYFTWLLSNKARKSSRYDRENTLWS